MHAKILTTKTVVQKTSLLIHYRVFPRLSAGTSLDVACDVPPALLQGIHYRLCEESHVSASATLGLDSLV